LLISERHELLTSGEERVSEYNFVMRCWERDELNTLLARHRLASSRASAHMLPAWQPVPPTDWWWWRNVRALRPNIALQPTAGAILSRRSRSRASGSVAPSS
jgi:hypothetical protein